MISQEWTTIITSITSLLTTALIGYIGQRARKFFRQHEMEHRYLMDTVPKLEGFLGAGAKTP